VTRASGRGAGRASVTSACSRVPSPALPRCARGERPPRCGTWLAGFVPEDWPYAWWVAVARPDRLFRGFGGRAAPLTSRLGGRASRRAGRRICVQVAVPSAWKLQALTAQREVAAASSVVVMGFVRSSRVIVAVAVRSLKSLIFVWNCQLQLCSTQAQRAIAGFIAVRPVVAQENSHRTWTPRAPFGGGTELAQCGRLPLAVSGAATPRPTLFPRTGVRFRAWSRRCDGRPAATTPACFFNPRPTRPRTGSVSLQSFLRSRGSCVSVVGAEGAVGRRIRRALGGWCSVAGAVALCVVVRCRMAAGPGAGRASCRAAGRSRPCASRCVGARAVVRSAF